MPSRISDRLLVLCLSLAAAAAAQAQNTVVRFTTSVGVFEVELFDQTGPGGSAAPRTVENFLNYVGRGDYRGTFLHRLVPGFVVQGGGHGFTDGVGLWQVRQDPPIANEFDIRRPNVARTIAMARLGGQPNSATSQFFINLVDNPHLNTVDGGFTVFGRVIDGWEVVQEIEQLRITNLQSLHFALGELPVMPSFNPFEPLAERHLVMIDVCILGRTCDPCYPDCDHNGTLDFFDFLCFQNAFLAQDPYADCTGDGYFDFFDFLCFQNEFLAGCP